MDTSNFIIGELKLARTLVTYMTINQHSLETDYHCPECSGPLSTRYESLACNDCGYTPRHGAD